MTEPDNVTTTTARANGPNWTTIALIAGLLLVVLLVAYFMTNRNSNQDKLTNENTSTATTSANPEKLCASKTTYDLIKRDLFRRAAQLRGSDQGAFDKLAAYASLRMENPVMESQDEKTGAVNCSASLSLDLPPGVEVVGGRRTLSADLDYVVQQAADGTGLVVLLRNADPIITPLATLAKGGQQPAATAQNDGMTQGDLPQPDDGAPAAPAAPSPPTPAPIPAPAPTPRPAPKPVGARPSFNCANARTKSEIAVCGDAGLASLDRNMAAQYVRAMSAASPDQQALLRRTRDRFLAYRDRCPNVACMGDAYTGRIREIRDIMEGRWAPPR